MLTEKDNEFLQQVKATVLSVDPTAEVWLFGSRARGDAREDSDWDFLVWTNKDLSGSQRWCFSDSLTDVELATNQAISTIVWPSHEKRRYAVTDLYKNVADEGIRL